MSVQSKMRRMIEKLERRQIESPNEGRAAEIDKRKQILAKREKRERQAKETLQIAELKQSAINKLIRYCDETRTPLAQAIAEAIEQWLERRAP